MRGRYNYNKSRKWSKKVFGGSIFELKRLFIPINLGQMHWALVVIHFRNKLIQYYDSMREDTKTKSTLLLNAKVCSIIWKMNMRRSMRGVKCIHHSGLLTLVLNVYLNNPMVSNTHDNFFQNSCILVLSPKSRKFSSYLCVLSQIWIRLQLWFICVHVRWLHCRGFASPFHSRLHW